MLTVTEIEFWIAYSIIQSAMRNDVDYTIHSLQETQNQIEIAKAKRERQQNSWKKPKK